MPVKASAVGLALFAGMASSHWPGGIADDAAFGYPPPPPAEPPLGRGCRSFQGSPMLHSIKQNWFTNIRGDVLSGLVVALALIPEAIAFSIIAGVDPRVGLYASFCIAVVIAFTGGRPGMISAAT